MTKIKPKRHLEELKVGYTPLRTPKQLAKEFDLPEQQIIKLDGNENPFGPAPEVIEALRSLSQLERYPDPFATSLCQKIANREGLSEDNVMITAGADELIDLLIRTFVSEEEMILTPSPTFGMYKFLSRVNGVNYIEQPMQLKIQGPIAHLVLNEEAFLKKAKKSKLVFISRPNNPDGSMIPLESLQKLLELPILVVVDEAYIEFASQPSLAPLINEHENLVIMRTFSKAHGIAGLRVGYGLMSAEIKKHLMKIKQPYNVNVAALHAAEASLNSKTVHDNVAAIKLAREQTFQRLLQLQQGLKDELFWIHPSNGPFLLMRFQTKRMALLMIQLLRQHGIFIRYYPSSTSHLASCMRVSIGKKEEMDAFLKWFEHGVNSIEKTSKN